MPYLHHDDAEIFYTDEGTGDPVLLLHGWSCDSHDWSFQIPALLEAGYRVIALDHRGHGRSSAPDGSYRPQVLADDAAALLTELGVESAVVGGHSMGTVVASALAVRHPDLVRGLFLVDPVYAATDESLAPILDAMRGPAPAQAAAAMFGMAFYVESTPAFLPVWHRRRVLGMPDHVVSGCILGLYDGDEGLARVVVATDYLKARTQPRLALYANPAAMEFELAFPVGEHDRVLAPEGVGHFLHQEQPELTNGHLLEWLAALPAAPQTTASGVA
jgi:pimeloyl-ACP methyl ester carboxylesterase